TDGYDCYQNALAERVNGILKGELLLQSPQDLTQAREMVREAVDIYNAERPHHALKYRTPDAVHRGKCQTKMCKPISGQDVWRFQVALC
ncbi:integrase core domain-containing protein, partial [Aeromonas veronii]